MFSVVAVPMYVPTCSLLLLNLMVGVEKGREERGWKMPELKSTHIYSVSSGHGRHLKLTLSLAGYFCGVFSSKSFIQMMYSPGDPVRKPFNPGSLTWVLQLG